MRIGSLFGRGVLAAALGTLLAGLGGCKDADTKTLLDPEGPPDVLQIFVSEDVDDGTGNIIVQQNLAYGVHPEACAESARPPGTTTDQFCNDVGDGTVSNATLAGNKMRIVVSELLDGKTVEEFKCACSAGECGPAPDALVQQGVCPAGIRLSAADPVCCGEDTNTPDIELGRWLDDDDNGVPDDATLIVDATAASLETQSGTEPFALADGDTLIVNFDGVDATITFAAADFANIAAATADEVAAAINAAGVSGAAATADAGRVTLTLTSSFLGTQSTVAVGAGTANAALGFSGTATGTVGDHHIDITCSVAFSGNVTTRVLGPEEAFYNPSGNQQVPVIFGDFGLIGLAEGLGPAIVIPAVDLPPNADCSISINGITDKDGEALVAPTMSFHTAAM